MSTDQRFACIILDDEVSGKGGFGPPPILIANQPVLARQIALLRMAGFSDVVALSRNTENPQNLQLGDAKPIGMVSSVPQLLEQMADNQSVLLMGEGCLPSLDLLKQMRAIDGGSILVRDAATSDDRHERIDLNDRFAGLLLMPKKALEKLPAMEADWSLLSMILRHAVQLDIARMPIPIGPMESLRCDYVTTADDADKWQFRALEAHIAEQSVAASPFKRWLLLPLAQLALPSLWSNGAPVLRYLPYVSVAMGGIALVLAWLAWPIAAIFFLLAAFVCDEILGQARGFAMTATTDVELRWAFIGVAFLFAPWMLLWSAAMPSTLAALLAGAAVSLAFLHQIFGRSPASSIWVGPVEAMVLAIVALIGGLSVGTTALLITVIVMLQNVWRPLLMRLNAI